MKIADELLSDVEALIAEQLGDGLQADVKIERIDVSESQLQIHIFVSIETEAKPSEIADRYFGLTGRVRDALGDSWRDFFPVITPNIGHHVNA
ncbi:hypothetical protein [Cognatiyoonia sp. IB215182]|uniref:hypothetical protein n=1 Tax=Cognatiyoonia sp. IB215182 TaxID=3097353 RepID=UPI002A0C3E26|nr:hypothetical protein [Cognatiyoonia sp. IB215182]MDX8354677.1 hypothetical protein [Cognatiyoonia sp. IB215182]